MIISSIKQSSSNTPNFGSVPLYRAILQQKRFFRKAEPIEAFVSTFEKSDLNRTSLSPQNWYWTSFGSDIIDEMMQHKTKKYLQKLIKSFLLVEVPALKGENQIRAMASYFFHKDTLCLEMLQSKTQTDFFRKIKGAGSLILYALSQIAQENKAKKVLVYSTADAINFYKRAGFKRIVDNEYYLSSTKFKSLQEKIEKKLNIEPVK